MVWACALLVKRLWGQFPCWHIPHFFGGRGVFAVQEAVYVVKFNVTPWVGELVLLPSEMCFFRKFSDFRTICRNSARCKRIGMHIFSRHFLSILLNFVRTESHLLC